MSSDKLSVLLVEDEENLHDALKLNLELEGYDITSAYDGNQALQKVEQEYFDLIIMDVMLPAAGWNQRYGKHPPAKQRRSDTHA